MSKGRSKNDVTAKIGRDPPHVTADAVEDESTEMSGRARVMREWSRVMRLSPEIPCDYVGEDKFKINFSQPCLADTGSTRALLSQFVTDKYGIQMTDTQIDDSR